VLKKALSLLGVCNNCRNAERTVMNCDTGDFPENRWDHSNLQTDNLLWDTRDISKVTLEIFCGSKNVSKSIWGGGGEGFCTRHTEVSSHVLRFLRLISLTYFMVYTTVTDENLNLPITLAWCVFVSEWVSEWVRVSEWVSKWASESHRVCCHYRVSTATVELG
jgi:hypothetical protein